jgi:hypothetical protein
VDDVGVEAANNSHQGTERLRIMSWAYGLDEGWQKPGLSTFELDQIGHRLFACR